MESPESTPSRAELSKTPSWIMLGFVLGVLTVMGFRKEQSPVPAVPEPAAIQAAQSAPIPQGGGKEKASEPAEQRSITSRQDRPSLVVIEAVFAQWGGYAIWEGEVTQVALWNSLTNDYTDYFEVLRTSSGYFYRSIVRLTRPWTDARPPRESPLRFTEPLGHRQARLEGRLAPASASPLDYLALPPTGPADSKR